MPNYRVKVSGHNIILDMDNELGRYWFEVTRFVNAPDVDEAKRRALELVTSSPQMATGLSNPPDNPPRFAVESAEEFEGAMPERQPGFAFYPDESN